MPRPSSLHDRTSRSPLLHAGNGFDQCGEPHSDVRPVRGSAEDHALTSGVAAREDVHELILIALTVALLK